MKRKVCVFTGTRAEYGLLKPLIDEIKSDHDLQLQIVASCMHLSPEFGLTYREIENDGFIIDEKVEMLLSSDSPIGICKSIGLGAISYGESLSRLCPDITVILGDRFEAISFTLASTVSKIPIAHIHGGEVTIGAFDDAFRHSITKMSHLHFTSTEEYRRRVIQLGENPERVFNVGALSIDNINRLSFLSRDELEKELRFKFKERNLMITFHPVTLEENSSGKQFKNLLDVLDELKDTLLIFTKANADTHGRIINKMIDDFVTKNQNKATAFTSLGQLNYLSVMNFVDGVVGNSSSGIVEAPSFKIGTINIGDRQKGRIKADSVIDCEPDKKSIKSALNTLYSQDFEENLKNVKNPHGDGNTAPEIKEIIKNYNLNNIIKKEFFNLKFDI